MQTQTIDFNLSNEDITFHQVLSGRQTLMNLNRTDSGKSNMSLEKKTRFNLDSEAIEERDEVNMDQQMNMITLSNKTLSDINQVPL